MLCGSDPLAGRGDCIVCVSSWRALEPLADKIETPEQLLWLYLGWSTLPPDAADAITRQVPVTDFWLFVFSLMVQWLVVLLYLRWRPLVLDRHRAASINLVVVANPDNVTKPGR